MFLLIWGSRTKERCGQQGYFFCPSCRRRQRVGLFLMERTTHLFFFPVSAPEVLAQYFRCDTCRHDFLADDGYPYDFSEHPAPTVSRCFRCKGEVLGHQVRCPHCGFCS